MRRALLDVNVLIAMLDSDHEHHGLAMGWWDEEHRGGWASCAITENGVVRVMSQPRYPGAVAPLLVAERLMEARSAGEYEFWPCDLSLLDAVSVDLQRLHGHRQITDAYLLALAIEHDGRVVTFDRSLPIEAVPGATSGHVTVL